MASSSSASAAASPSRASSASFSRAVIATGSSPVVPGMLRGAAEVFEYPMIDRDPVPQWSFGRATLLGDAAHPVLPHTGQGAAQALEDAVALLGRLPVSPTLAWGRWLSARPN